MKYERLTERRETPLVMSQWGGTSKELKIYNRLAEFEDKIENGTLIELPCKVGDTVYFVYETVNETMFMDKGVIQSFSYDEQGVWFRATYEYLSSYWHSALSIGETVFLTKGEAEAKLKELKGE